MREIKFRAWDKYRNRLINDVLTIKFHRITNDPCLVVYTDKKIKNNSEIKESDKKYCNEFNLMQYTGLNDKNGTRIFEGDILEMLLKDSDGKIEYKLGAVEYSTRSLEYLIRTKEGLVYSFGPILNGAGFYEFELEVIGNIYDNKDLL